MLTSYLQKLTLATVWNIHMASATGWRQVCGWSIQSGCPWASWGASTVYQGWASWLSSWCSSRIHVPLICSVLNPGCSSPSHSCLPVSHTTCDSVSWMWQEKNVSLWQCPEKLGSQTLIYMPSLSPTGEITGQESLPWHWAVLPGGRVVQLQSNCSSHTLQHIRSQILCSTSMLELLWWTLVKNNTIS